MTAYSSWVYRKVDNVVEGIVVTGEDAVRNKLAEGWKLSPAEFVPEEDRKNLEASGISAEKLTTAIDDHALLMNRLLNFDSINDKDTLKYIAEDLGIDSDINWSEAGRRTLAHVKKDLKKQLTKMGLLDAGKNTHH